MLSVLWSVQVYTNVMSTAAHTLKNDCYYAYARWLSKKPKDFLRIKLFFLKAIIRQFYNLFMSHKNMILLHLGTWIDDYHTPRKMNAHASYPYL